MAKTFEVKTRLTAEDDASPAVARAEGAFRKFATYLSGVFVITLNDVARIAQAAFARIFDVAQLEGQTQAVRIELAKQGQSFDEFIAKLDQVARGTVSTADLIKSSSQALLLGIPAEQIAALLEIARASAVATGQSVSEAFDNIATGIGRASPMILDNLGIVVRLGPAYDAMAQSLGKTVEQLTAAEQKQALLGEVLRVGQTRVEAYGEAHSVMAEKIAQAAAATDNFTAGASKAVSVLGTTAALIINASAAGYAFLALAINRARIAFNEWTGDLDEAISIARTNVEIEKMIQRMDALGRSLATLRDQQIDQILGRGGDAAQKAAEKTARLALAAEDTRVRTEGMTRAVDAEVAALTQVTQATISATTAEEEHARAIIFTAQAFEFLARTQGRGVATEAAVAAGGRTILGGTRVLLPGGGSRLTSEPGFGRFGG